MIARKYLIENYDCAEYLSKYDNGLYDDKNNVQLVLPVSEASINPKHHHLVIGTVGTDGVELCFRIHKTGVWAFYPLEDRFHRVATRLSQLTGDF